MAQGSGAVLTDLSDAGLAAAIEANQVEIWRALCAYRPDWHFREEPELTWFTTGIASAPWYNQVLLTRLAPDDADTRINETLALFGERRLPMLWSVTSSTRPVHLGSLLATRGLSRGESLAGMAVDLDKLAQEPPTPAAFAIERVSDAGALERWARSYIDGFAMAESAGHVLHDLYASIGFSDHVPFRHYVGTLNGEPVASSTLFVGAGVAAIWHVGTLSVARRSGIGTAMTLAPLRDAQAMGYRAGVLYASPMGLSVYRRLGFEQYNEMVQYHWSPDR